MSKRKSVSRCVLSILAVVCMIALLLPTAFNQLSARAASGYMLKVRTETSSWGRFQQEVTLPETGEYIFEAYFKQTVGTSMSLKVMRSDGGIGDKVLSETTDDKTSLHQIRFLADQVNSDGTIKYQITISVGGSNSANEAYLYLPSVYKADDVSKTNLLTNTVNSTDLSGWVDRKNWGATAMNAAAVTADPTLFGIVEEKPEYMMKVKLAKGGYGRVRQSVKLTETGHYVYQAYFKQTVGSSLKMSVLYNYAGAEIVSDVTDEKTGLRTVEFNAKAAGSYMVAVSTGWANKGDEAYLYRPVVYKADDANKTNLLTNSTFENDLSGWTDWSTLETRDGLVNLGAERVEADLSIFAGEETVDVKDSEGNVLATVNAGDALDLSTLTLPVRDGYWFAGYYTDAACTQPFATGTAISEDTTLYYGWVDAADFDILGVQVRLTEPNGLRFMCRAKTSMLEQLEALNVQENSMSFGMLLQPENKMGNAAFTREDATTSKYLVDRNADHYAQKDEHTYFNAVVIDIPETRYAATVVLRSYVTYLDASGIERTYYNASYTSATLTDSPYAVASLVTAAQATLDADAAETDAAKKLSDAAKARLEEIISKSSNV